MAEIIKVKISFDPEANIPLDIPNEVRAPRKSIIQWNIVGIRKGWPRLDRYRDGIIFTIYFEDESPFGWKRQFRQVYEEIFYPRPFPDTIRLAEDVADRIGDFKYGISVSDASSGEILYDEDPYLKIF